MIIFNCKNILNDKLRWVTTSQQNKLQQGIWCIYFGNITYIMLVKCKIFIKRDMIVYDANKKICVDEQDVKWHQIMFSGSTINVDAHAKIDMKCFAFC